MYCDMLMTTCASQSHSDKFAVRNVRSRASFDVGGDTDPATDTEETPTTMGKKRKAGGSTGPAPKYIPHVIHVDLVF